jgi:N-acylneuraminate cytidylyltransferase
MRPQEISGDSSPEWYAWQHALRHFQDLNGFLPEAFVSIPATAPLRLTSDIERCLSEFERVKPDAIITMTESRRNPYFNMVLENSNGLVNLVGNSESTIVRRQDAPPIFDIATVCYILNPEFVLTHNSIFDGKVKGVQIPAERALDIDNLFDFEIADFFLSLKGVQE